MEKIKINPVPMKVNPDFRIFVIDIIHNRKENGIDSRYGQEVRFDQITKAIVNQYNANPKFLKMLEEVLIKNGE